MGINTKTYLIMPKIAAALLMIPLHPDALLDRDRPTSRDIAQEKPSALQILQRRTDFRQLDQDEGARQACLKLAEDEKVFAVFNTTGFGPPGSLCLTREKGVPFLQGSGHPDEVYAQSNGLYSSTFDSQTRNFRNLVGTLDRMGLLKGKKIGVLGTEWIGLRRETEEGVVQTLRSLGYEPYELNSKGFSVRGVEHLRERFSKRSRAVEKLAADFAAEKGRKPTKREVEILVRETDRPLEALGGRLDKRERKRPEARMLRQARTWAS